MNDRLTDQQVEALTHYSYPQGTMIRNLALDLQNARKERAELRGLDAEIRSARQILEGLKDFAPAKEMNWIQKSLIAIANMRQQLADARAALKELGEIARCENKDWCPCCEGSGRLYADEKPYTFGDSAPTRACDICDGKGCIIPDYAQALNEKIDALIKKGDVE